MQGHARILEMLNRLLSEELTAINQYMVHAEMCGNWGYGKLEDGFEKRSIVEMKHAEKLIARILFLEGQPVVSELREVRIGRDVPKMVTNDLDLEYQAVKEYNDAIRLCAELVDNGTRQLLQEILDDEDDHVDQLESARDQIGQMGVQLFLSSQTA